MNPFRYSWLAWAIAVALLILVPLALAQDTKPDGPVVEDITCHKGWCMIKHDTLKKLLDGMLAYGKHVKELRDMCGWKDR